MGHRRLFNTAQMFECEQHDQSWNAMHVGQPHANLVVGGLPESASFFYPFENLAVDGLHFSQWNPTPTPNGYIASNRIKPSYYQPDSSRPPHDPFLRLATAGTFSSVPENHLSSSNYDRQTFNGSDNSYFDVTMDSGRGPHKRKSHGISSAWDRGSTSTHYAGSSSDIPQSHEPWLDKPYSDRHYMQWEQMTMTPNYQGAASNRAESSTRNVKSRSAHDLESNLVRSHQTNNCSHGSYSPSHNYYRPGPMNLLNQSSGDTTHQWNHARMVPVHARIPVSDPNGSNQEEHHFHFELSGSNGAAGMRGYHHNPISYRDHVVHQSFHVDLPHHVRGARTSYSQRPGSSFRASSGSFRLGHGASSQESSQIIAQCHFSRHPRLSDRLYRSLSNEGNLHDRLPSEGHIVMDRAAYYGSRSAVDPHRDMRLDVDSMTYEELLALGERIGRVSTGLPEDSISKSLTKTVYRSLQKTLEAGNCAICLEDYKDKDDVGTLRTCGHDYHVNCIKKWLSMKNLCPICKALAMPGDRKDP